MELLLYSKRHKLAKLFKKWCEENNVDEKDTTNMITWLHLNGLLNDEKVIKFLEVE